MAHTFFYSIQLHVPCSECGSITEKDIKQAVQDLIDPIMGEVVEVTRIKDIPDLFCKPKPITMVEVCDNCGGILTGPVTEGMVACNCAAPLPMPPITIWDKNRKEFKRVKGGDEHGH